MKGMINAEILQLYCCNNKNTHTHTKTNKEVLIVIFVAFYLMGIILIIMFNFIIIFLN